MTNRTPEPNAVDRWLRRGLEPELETPRRISRQALSAPPSGGRTLMRNRWALSGTAVLVAVVLASIWTRSGSAPPLVRDPIRITNFGELVSAVDPAGNVWLHAPEREIAADSPRLIITLGGANAE